MKLVSSLLVNRTFCSPLEALYTPRTPYLTNLSSFFIVPLLAFSKTSLLIFKDTSTFRKSMVKLMVHPMFDNVILTAIALNSVMLAVTDYSTVRLDVDEDR